MSHHCHATGCNADVPPVMFMCRKHWYMLPKPMRDAIWRTYRPGQCDDWKISHEYAEAARTALRYIATREGREADTSVYDMLDPAKEATETKLGGWRAGRMDAVSYDADGDGPYKQVYVDNPEGRMHMGERLPDVVCKAYGVQGKDCREVALLVAAAPDLLEALRLYDVWQSLPTDRGGKDGTKGKAHAAFIAAKDAALAKAEPPEADEPDDTDLYVEKS